MNGLSQKATIRNLEHRIQTSHDDDEKDRLRDTLAEVKHESLSGAGHHRDEGADRPSS